jgi:hypothetical protein
MSVVRTTLNSKFFKATAIVIMLAGPAYVQAQAISTSATVEAVSEPKARINYLETDKNNMLFEVRVDNASGEKFYIIVKDEQGTSLFSGSFKDKLFGKKFLLPKPENDKLTFVIKSSTGKVVETFEINSEVRFVEDVIVKKIV